MQSINKYPHIIPTTTHLQHLLIFFSCHVMDMHSPYKNIFVGVCSCVESSNFLCLKIWNTAAQKWFLQAGALSGFQVLVVIIWENFREEWAFLAPYSGHCWYCSGIIKWQWIPLHEPEKQQMCLLMHGNLECSPLAWQEYQGDTILLYTNALQVWH